jgi:hypothetical protein
MRWGLCTLKSLDADKVVRINRFQDANEVIIDVVSGANEVIDGIEVELYLRTDWNKSWHKAIIKHLSFPFVSQCLPNTV